VYELGLSDDSYESRNGTSFSGKKLEIIYRTYCSAAMVGFISGVYVNPRKMTVISF
jgi:hypothetical protein